MELCRRLFVKECWLCFRKDIVGGDANGMMRYTRDRNRAVVSALLELLHSERATPFDTPFRPLPPYIGRYGWKARSQISAELLNFPTPAHDCGCQDWLSIRRIMRGLTY